jgi:hypothetical protein
MFDLNDPRPSPFDRKKKDGESSPAAAKSANLVDKWGNPPTMIDRAFGLKGFGPAKPEAIAPKPAGLKLPQELDDEAKARGRAYGAIGATGMVPQNPAGAPMPQPEKPFFNLNDPRPSPFAIGMQQPATAELPQPVAKVQQQPPGGVMVDRFGNQPSWLERKLGMTNGLRPEGTVPQATPIIDMPQLDPQQIADAQGRGRAYGILPPKQAVQQIAQPVAAQPVSPQSTEATPAAATPQPVAATPITSQVVSDTDRLESDRLVRGVMGKNANQNLQNINNDASVRDTMNKAWAMRGAGIQVQQGANGPVFSNSTGPEKMRYTGADGKATNNWSDTAEFKQGIDTAGRIKALADGLERQRYLDAGDGERLGAIDRMRQTDAGIENAKATQGIAQQELGMKKEAHGIQMKNDKIWNDALQEHNAALQSGDDAAINKSLEKMKAIRGKFDENRYSITPDKVTPDPMGGPPTVSHGYVLDRMTGKERQLGAGNNVAPTLPADTSQRKAGVVYKDMTGRLVKWDGKGAVPVGG